MSSSKRLKLSPGDYMTRKTKHHPRYAEVVSNNSVTELRKEARSIGTKRWYSLKKTDLASSIVVHESACVVAKFFQNIVHCKRSRTYRSQALAGAQCPISLASISEMDFHDTYVHGGFVFSKEAVLEYIDTSVDFLNPITRTMMHYHDIQRLGCPYACEKYRNRVALRQKEVGAVQHFSFLEGEIENIMTGLLQDKYHYASCEDFTRAMASFHQTWRAMKNIDRNRTICVLKSLKQLSERFRNRPRAWGLALLDNALAKT